MPRAAQPVIKMPPCALKCSAIAGTAMKGSARPSSGVKSPPAQPLLLPGNKTSASEAA